jgi:hypothetical protein
LSARGFICGIYVEETEIEIDHDMKGPTPALPKSEMDILYAN